jgi:hypothetical protein
VEEFDLEAFFAWVEASARERTALRQDLVRGLKDYYQRLYGYDRYGAETTFLVSERMAVPYIFGFAVLRALADRRLSVPCKLLVAERALAVTEYGQDQGTPHGLYLALLFMADQGALATPDLRYALTVTSYAFHPFSGMDRHTMSSFLRTVMDNRDLPAEERAFWTHSLVARHAEDTGEEALVNTALGHDSLPVELRRELAWSWVYCRQPRLEVPIPPHGDTVRGRFVAEHLPFWVAHMPSRASNRMVRLGLIWLARLGEDPETVAEAFIERSDPFAEQFQYAVGDIIAEHEGDLGPVRVRELVDLGLDRAASAAVRRKFYSLGSTLVGEEYLQRAAADPAGSVRQWAARASARHQ